MITLNKVSTFLSILFLAIMGVSGLLSLFASDGNAEALIALATGIEEDGALNTLFGAISIFVAGMLVAGFIRPAMFAGSHFIGAMLLLGMAGGRTVTILLDDPSGAAPYSLLAIELLLAGALLISNRPGSTRSGSA